MTDLVASGDLGLALATIFAKGDPRKPVRLYRHQAQAIAKAKTGRSYVVTSETGSGRSLSFFIPIIDEIVRLRRASQENRKFYQTTLIRRLPKGTWIRPKSALAILHAERYAYAGRRPLNVFIMVKFPTVSKSGQSAYDIFRRKILVKYQTLVGHNSPGREEVFALWCRSSV